MSPTAAPWSVAEIPDQSGHVALVTGANSGLGLETAKALAAKGAHVVLAARDAGRGAAALAEVQALGAADLVALDLADLAQVAAAAAQVIAQHERLDLLVNNAGVMATPRRRSADGHELQMATNHLGHFALTGLLLPLLLTSPDPRVVTVSSQAHRIGRLGVGDPLGEQERYRAWPAYGRSKLANLLFTFELQRRADQAERQLLSVAAHPGLSATNLVGSGPMRRIPGLAQISTAVNGMWSQPAAHGAWSILYAATRPGLVGGEYVGPSGPGEVRGSPVFVRANPAAYDESLARALWARSFELTGVDYAALDA
ncbi:MAG: oxidoreductase [Actinomycetota bacterium]|nr:oxidoreductase [Actinomycetota bacterium]